MMSVHFHTSQPQTSRARATPLTSSVFYCSSFHLILRNSGASLVMEGDMGWSVGCWSTKDCCYSGHGKCVGKDRCFLLHQWNYVQCYNTIYNRVPIMTVFLHKLILTVWMHEKGDTVCIYYPDRHERLNFIELLVSPLNCSTRIQGSSLLCHHPKP